MSHEPKERNESEEYARVPKPQVYDSIINKTPLSYRTTASSAVMHRRYI